MEAFISTIVVLIQLLLGGFVLWGGWLLLREHFRGERADDAHRAATPAAPAKVAADDFERVASLVLLALLCTTLVAAA